MKQDQGAKTRPRVLVLMATYNGEAWVSEQVESILQQQQVDLKLVIRDDGSSDQTVQKLKDFGLIDQRIEILADRSPTGSAAQNFFRLIATIDAAAYNYVAFSDQDDIWRDDKLIRGANILLEKCCAGYSSAVTAHWPNGVERIISQSKNTTEADYLFEGGGQGCSFIITASNFSLIQKTLLRIESRLENIHYHDWLMYAITRASGAKWYFDDRSSMQYRQHENNDTGAKLSFAGITSRFKKMRSGWYAKQIIGITEALVAAGFETPRIAEWQKIYHLKRRNDLLATFSKINFVLRHGRRAKVERIISLLGIVGNPQGCP